MRDIVHPSHKMGEWKSTIVTLSSGNSRFGEIRKCEYCGAAHARTVGGQEAEPELYDPCGEAPADDLSQMPLEILAQNYLAVCECQRAGRPWTIIATDHVLERHDPRNMW